MEIVTGMRKKITMYLVSNPTSLSPQPLASPAAGLSLVGVGAGGCGGGGGSGETPGTGGLRAISDSRPTATETLTYVTKTVWT